MTTGAPGRGTTLLAAGLMLVLPAPGPAAAEPGGTPAPVARHTASAASRPAAPASRPAAPASRPAAPAPRTVTLVTGDRVTVTDLGGGKRTVTVERPEGATGAVRTRTAGGDLTVVTDEALPYLRAGRLDRRLFDVSGLLRQQPADTATGELPLIVTHGAGRRAAVPPGTRRTRPLTSVHGDAVRAGKSRTFWTAFTRPGGSGVDTVWLDARVRAGLAESNAQIGTAAAWDTGLTGREERAPAAPARRNRSPAGDHPTDRGTTPWTTPRSTRSCGPMRSRPAVAGASSGGRLSIAVADSGAITEK